MQQEKKQGEEGDKSHQERGEERHEVQQEEKEKGGSSERVPIANTAMLRQFTIHEHEQRFEDTNLVIGSGIYSHVLRGYDKQDDVFVALKVRRPGAPCMKQEVAIMTYANPCVICGANAWRRCGSTRCRSKALGNVDAVLQRVLG